jgi:antitoxin (DNA-binding transcriptional repressor) of toxin-antitoxin stability system
MPVAQYGRAVARLAPLGDQHRASAGRVGNSLGRKAEALQLGVISPSRQRASIDANAVPLQP